MSLIAVGLSHRSAPVPLLEEAALGPAQVEDLAAGLAAAENLAEVVVLATCNRLEVYAEAATFHGAVADIGAALVRATGIGRDRLTEHLYVHYEERAVAHLFTVACGMDSMAVGETQILGQLRTALRAGQRAGRVGPVLNVLGQQALRVGKRAHTDTALDTVGASLVTAGLSLAAEHVGPLSGSRVLVIGAGSMSALVATTVSRAGSADLVLVNRTHARAEHLAAATGARAVRLAALPEALAEADVVVSCTGAVGFVVDDALATRAGRARDGRRQAYVDLALPRDVDPGVARVPGAAVVGLAEIGAHLAAAGGADAELRQVEDLVTAEVAAYLAHRRQQEVAPTVAALRARAADLLAAELDRLDGRVPDLDDHSRDEVRLAMHRLVEKLLHTPTVRVKELVGSADPGDYAHALRELFGLDPYDVAAVATPPDKGVLP